LTFVAYIEGKNYRDSDSICGRHEYEACKEKYFYGE